jgi:hypothetical protein
MITMKQDCTATYNGGQLSWRSSWRGVVLDVSGCRAEARREPGVRLHVRHGGGGVRPSLNLGSRSLARLVFTFAGMAEAVMLRDGIAGMDVAEK